MVNAKAKSPALKISRILHAGYVFEGAGQRLLFDPIFENPFSRNCFAFPSASFRPEQIRQTEFSAVFISHFHDDHCSLDSLDLLHRATPIFVYCVHPELCRLIGELGFREVRPLELGRVIEIGDFRVTPHPAFDSEIDSIFEIELAEFKVLNVVDALMAEDTLRYLSAKAPWDLVLWPFQNMLETKVLAPSRFRTDDVGVPKEWIEELGVLRPRYVVPSSCQFLHESWSWYNQAMFPVSYDDFARVIERACRTKVIRMNPSTSFVLNREGFEPAKALTWVVPEGPQDVDYDYRPDQAPSPVSEIAKRFTALTDQQFATVNDFCEREFILRYAALEVSRYFSQERIWRLSVYDGFGEKSDRFYLICNGSALRIYNPRGPLAWVTEVSAAKLYAAIELGETLTSMYVRVNDCLFSAEIEAELVDFDVFEDPLIRTLFNGQSGDSFGSYQRAQLRRLLARKK